MLLLAQSCTVTVYHSRSKDLAFRTWRADILVTTVRRAAPLRCYDPGPIRPERTRYPGNIV